MGGLDPLKENQRICAKELQTYKIKAKHAKD
jgi:hypothetical protein